MLRDNTRDKSISIVVHKKLMDYTGLYSTLVRPEDFCICNKKGIIGEQIELHCRVDTQFSFEYVRSKFF